MSPTILLIRHGQAVHNDFDLPDPLLTPEGEKQCRKLNQNLSERFAGIDVNDVAVIVSPMRRTIQTALIGLRFLREKGVLFIADADWQETTSKPCDIGTPIKQLKEEFPFIDYSTLDPVFPDKTSPASESYAWTRKSLLERGQRAKDNLRQRKEMWVIVVSHSGFLRQAVSGWWYTNADYRIFDFTDDPEEETGLQVWKETEAGGMGASWTERVKLGEGIKGIDEQ